MISVDQWAQIRHLRGQGLCSEELFHGSVGVAVVRHWCAPGRYPGRCSGPDLDPAPVLSGRVIIVGAVVVPAQHRQVVHIRLSTPGPGFDVVDFAVISSMPAIRHRTGRHGGACEVALFLVREALRVIQVDGSFLRVEHRYF